MQLIQICLPALYITVGLVTNVLSGILYLLANQTKNKMKSYMPFLIGASLVSSIYLTTLLISWLQTVGIDLISPELCHFLTFFRGASGFLHTWFMVALSVHQYILVTKPYCAKKVLTRASSAYVCIAMSIVAVVVFLNIAPLQGIVVIQNFKTCSFLPNVYKITIILMKARFFLNNVLPCISIFWMNTCTLRHLLKRNSSNAHGLFIVSQTVMIIHKDVVRSYNRRLNRTVLFISVLTFTYTAFATSSWIADLVPIWFPMVQLTNQQFIVQAVCNHMPNIFHMLPFIFYITLDINFYRQFKKACFSMVHLCLLNSLLRDALFRIFTKIIKFRLHKKQQAV